jgi:hypothetical protein
LTKWQTGDAGPPLVAGNADPTTGGAESEAGDRQLGHPLHLSRSPMPAPPKPPAKAGEIAIIAVTALKSSVFMELSLRCPRSSGSQGNCRHRQWQYGPQLFVDQFAFTQPACA